MGTPHYGVDCADYHRLVIDGPTAGVLAAVAAERARQDLLWQEQNHPDGTGRVGDREAADAARARCKANGPGEDNWRDILDEEIAEAYAETDWAKLRVELVQCMAVLVNWVESGDRRNGVDPGPQLAPNMYTLAAALALHQEHEQRIRELCGDPTPARPIHAEPAKPMGLFDPGEEDPAVFAAYEASQFDAVDAGEILAILDEARPDAFGLEYGDTLTIHD